MSDQIPYNPETVEILEEALNDAAAAAAVSEVFHGDSTFYDHLADLRDDVVDHVTGDQHYNAESTEGKSS